MIRCLAAITALFIVNTGCYICDVRLGQICPVQRQHRIRMNSLRERALCRDEPFCCPVEHQTCCLRDDIYVCKDDYVEKAK